MDNIGVIKKRIVRNKLFNDSFWAVFGNVVVKGLGLLAGIFVARFLGKEIFGEYGMIKNTLTSVAVFSTFGLGYTSTKYIASAKSKEFFPIIIKNSIIITTVVSGTMALLLFFGSSYISIELLGNSDLIIPLKFTAMWIVFNAVSTSQIGILSGFGLFKKMARVNFMVGVSTFTLSLIFTYYFALTGALAALLLAQVINCILNYRLIRTVYKPRYTIDKRKNNEYSISKMVKFAFPVAMQEGVFSLSSWTIAWMIIRFGGYGELGLYSAAIQWSTIVLFVPGVLRNVVLSHLSNSLNDESKHSHTIKTLLLFNFCITLIPFVIIFFFSDIISSFYGASFSRELPGIITIAILSVIPVSLSNVYIQAFLSKGANWLIFVAKLSSFILIISISYTLISEYFKAAVYAVLLVALVINSIHFCFLALVYKRFNIFKFR